MLPLADFLTQSCGVPSRPHFNACRARFQTPAIARHHWGPDPAMHVERCEPATVQPAQQVGDMHVQDKRELAVCVLPARFPLEVRRKHSPMIRAAVSGAADGRQPDICRIRAGAVLQKKNPAMAKTVAGLCFQDGGPGVGIERWRESHCYRRFWRQPLISYRQNYRHSGLRHLPAWLTRLPKNGQQPPP